MQRRLQLILGLLTVLFATPVWAQDGFELLGVDNGRVVSAPASYTGPGDVVAGAKVWLGLRAYNATWADGTHKSVALVRTDTHTCDVLLNTSGGLGNTTNCSTGAENGTAVALWCTATTCKIDKWYDQSGNGFDFTTTTSATRATLTFSCLGSLPCADFGAGTSWYDSVISDTAQSFTTSLVGIRTGSFGTQNDLFDGTSGTFYDGSASKVGAYFGASATVTASDSVWHAIQIVTNGSSSAIAVDATQTTALAMGANSTGANIFLGSQSSVGTNPLNGKIAEIGIWGPSIAFSTTQMTNVCHNQFVYWGTPTSC